MIGRGQWDSNADSLSVSFDEAEWHITIHRCGGQPCERQDNYAAVI
jgi:hypothetical protein